MVSHECVCKGFYGVDFAGGRRGLDILIAGGKTRGRVAVSRGHARFILLQLEKCMCVQTCESVCVLNEHFCLPGNKCTKGTF